MEPTPLTTQTQPHLKWVYIVIAAVVILAIAFFAVRYFYPAPASNNAPVSQTQSQAKPQVKKNTVQRTAVDQAKLPKGIPTDLPIETNAKITKNYTQTNIQGFIESVREYESSMSIADLSSAYQGYFSKNGWTVLQNTDKQTGSVAILASKDTQNLAVQFSENSITKVRTVEISSRLK